MKSTLFFIGLFLMNLAIADDLSDSNIIFDLLERDYPELYSPSDAETYISDGYIVRYYESTDNYLGTKEGKVYEYVEESDEMEDLGSIEEFLIAINEEELPNKELVKEISDQNLNKSTLTPFIATKLGRGYSTNVQFLQFTFFEKDINSVRCCIEYGSPGNQGFYCETFSGLNACPSPFK